MTRLLLLGLVGALIASPLAAQGVVRPDPPLDPGRARVRDALLVLRDSLSTIDAAAARLQRDARMAAPSSLVARARLMSDACSRSGRSIDPARRSVVQAEVAGTTQAQRRREMVRSLDRLRGELARCRAEFEAMSKPDRGRQVLDYGNERAGRIQRALRRYEGTLGEFFGAMGIQVRPLGAGPSPLAG